MSIETKTKEIHFFLFYFTITIRTFSNQPDKNMILKLNVKFYLPNWTINIAIVATLPTMPRYEAYS